MNTINIQKLVFYFAVLLTAVTFISINPTKAQAQQVIGVSIVFPHPYTLDTYSGTHLDYVANFYYNPYVDGYHFKRSLPFLPWEQINNGYAYAPTNATAGGYLQSPLTVPSEYVLRSEHFLIAYYSYYDDTLGLSYWNPHGYGFISTGNPSGFQFSSGSGPTFVAEELIYLGATIVYYPVIPTLSITPFSSVMEGGSREVEVKFENLPFNDYAHVTLPVVNSNGHATFDSGSYGLVVGNGTNKVKLKGTIKSDSTDDQKIKIEYGGVQAEELFSVVKLNLNNVSFAGSNYPVIKDDSLIHEPYNAPHWKVAGALHEQNSPVCYKSGTAMKVFAEWTASPDTTIDFPAPKVKGDGNGNLDFPSTDTVINSGASGNTVKINSNGATASNSFSADTIDYLDPLNIDWSISSQVSTASDSWQAAGVSKNPVYVLLNAPPATFTYSDPASSPFSTNFVLKDALLYISCKNAKGLNGSTAAGKDLILASIWNDFTDQKIETRPQYDLFSDSIVTAKLSYYATYLTTVTFPWTLSGTSPTGPYTRIGLIENTEGQCGSFALLLAASLRLQGLTQSLDYVFARPVTSNAAGFFIKNWNYGSARGVPLPEVAGFPYMNLYYGNSRVDSKSWKKIYSYDWLPNGFDVTDVSGVSGQGTLNPASIFNNHQFLRIGSAANPTQVTYYDPSYGVTYSSLQDFQNKSVTGFFKAVYYAGLYETFVNVDLDKNNVIENKSVSTGYFGIKKSTASLGVEFYASYSIQ
jgi:hypothetical protein